MSYYDQQRTYYAKRLKKVNPFFPENRIILLERDERHATPENPRGDLLVAEGRTFRAYPTPAIKRLTGTLLEVVEPGASKASHEPAPDSITAILDDEGLVRLLEKQGIDTVPVLVEYWVSGKVDSIERIGEARKAKIRLALMEAGLIKVDDAELDKLAEG